MLNPLREPSSHEDVFLERYAELRSWALRLSENDTDKAEDLVQEAFIHFTLARPDLHAIINLEGYLYQVLRNLHLSQERRASRSRLQQLSVFEYDTLALALRRVPGSVDRLQAQDELKRVCHYSCVRKETARAASVLILRFFHGYYPSEIARITLTSRRAVDERLRIARSEARLYLDSPERLRFMSGNPRQKFTGAENVRDTDSLLAELRRMIFNSREGECLSRAELERLYKSDGAQMPVKQLAHIVSCRACLETVNSILGFSSLNDRYPPDMMGKDSQSKGEGTRTSRKGFGGGEPLNKYRRRAREVFEHRPQELYFLVNGFIIGSQRINSELSEQTLDISIAESVGFVEVCSEQDVRLFFMSVEPPPEGAVKQPSRVELSDGRSLELTLTFDNKWPALHTAYRDPLMKAAPHVEEILEDSPAPGSIEIAHVEAAAAGARSSAWSRFAASVNQAGRRLMPAPFRLRPELVTAALALLLIAALVFFKSRTPEANATELLQKSLVAEEKRNGNTELVFHRKIRFEEWGEGRLLARNTIEVWRSGARELTVRRVYTEEGKLIAGEWIRENGTSTLYQHGSAPQERAAPASIARAILETGELWRLDASARDFSALVGTSDGMTAREVSGAYVIEYGGAKDAEASSLVQATLTLRQGDLRAVEQRLVVERAGVRREYRFTEELFEKYPKSHVGRSFFIPDAELLTKPSDTPGAQDSLKNSSVSTPEAVTSVAASPELEIEVAYLLNRIKANLGEQVSMTRTTGGTLRVYALVESEGRKEEILRALSPINNNPAVKVEVRSVTDAAGAQDEQGRSKMAETNVREVVVSNNRIPAYAELRAYFSQRVVGDAAIDEEVERYSARVMAHSRQALVRASALKRLVSRFSTEELRALQPEARAKWLAMISEHALAYRRELLALRQELRPVFGGSDEAAADALAEADISQSAERLLQFSYANDEAVRSAFTISAEGGSRSAIKTRQFWQRLATTEKLARVIEGAYQK